MKIIRNNEKAEASSYFAVEILYEGFFGHVTTFWIFTCYNCADSNCCKHSNNKLALVCFILEVNLCEYLQKQENEALSDSEWKP